MLKNRFKEDMEVLSAYKEKLAAVQKIIGRLENGSLEITELSELEQLTREIHERSIILRYKAMEQQIKPELKVTETPVVEPISVVVPDEPVAKEVELFDAPETEPAEEVSLDFALFDTENEAESIEEKMVVETTEVEPEIVEETVVEIEEETAPAQETVTSVSGFVARVHIPADAMANFSVVKINSLIGALGLNERLRFINGLFDGSSEDFSDAIKKLDTFESMSEASKTMDELAAKNEWNASEEVVQEFVIFLKRRYA